MFPAVKFTLDIGHCIQNGDDYLSFIELNKDRIVNIHLHNALKDGKAHYGFHKNGQLNLKKLISTLKRIQYSGFMSLEILQTEDIKKSWAVLLNSL